ncbi:mCpol domain-containing protein [Pseudomonas chlororaphis]|uniref:mCpol domain-containing protein n=1 Tax=Pseudomonas chlororaphis TaxID=587753 RepID=UPI002407845C|nr:mCpol domain-containing protein [Pseudomonas chlororaphis]
MQCISIDGDDVGRRITACYLNNDSEGLAKLSFAMKISVESISDYLSKIGFSVVFCAADGVFAEANIDVDFEKVFCEVSKLAPVGVTFSAGVGGTPRESYIALMSAKSNGKNCVHKYSEVVSGVSGGWNV